jgi:hypothetical protein
MQCNAYRGHNVGFECGADVRGKSQDSGQEFNPRHPAWKTTVHWKKNIALPYTSFGD